MNRRRFLLSLIGLPLALPSLAEVITSKPKPMAKGGVVTSGHSWTILPRSSEALYFTPGETEVSVDLGVFDRVPELEAADTVTSYVLAHLKDMILAALKDGHWLV